MYDYSLFLRSLSEFSARVPSPDDVDAALWDLTERLRDVLRLDGAAMAWSQDGRMGFKTAVPDRLVELEMAQIDNQAGPCMDTCRTGQIVAITDVATERDRWPHYCEVAARLGLTSVAGIPMQLSGDTFGAVNLFSARAREWSEDVLAPAVVLANMASHYVAIASRLRTQDQLNEQLQGALVTRATIEQAKGIMANERGITVDQAFSLIRSHARNHNVTVRSVADAIVGLGLRI